MNTYWASKKAPPIEYRKQQRNDLKTDFTARLDNSYTISPNSHFLTWLLFVERRRREGPWEKINFTEIILLPVIGVRVNKHYKYPFHTLLIWMWSFKEDNWKKECVKMVNYLMFCFAVLEKPTSMKTDQSWRVYSGGTNCVRNGPAGGHNGCQKNHRIMAKN